MMMMTITIIIIVIIFVNSRPKGEPSDSSRARPVATRCSRHTPMSAVYARRMGQPTQKATNYTARSNIDTAQIFLHANGQRPKRASIRQRSRRRQRRGEPHTEHGFGALNTFHTHTVASMKRDRRKSYLAGELIWVSKHPTHLGK